MNTLPPDPGSCKTKWIFMDPLLWGALLGRPIIHHADELSPLLQKYGIYLTLCDQEVLCVIVMPLLLLF